MPGAILNTWDTLVSKLHILVKLRVYWRRQTINVINKLNRMLKESKYCGKKKRICKGIDTSFLWYT